MKSRAEPKLPASSDDGKATAAAEADVAARGSGIKLAAELSGRLLSLATSFLLAVGLGVEGFGVFAAASGVAVILAEAADLGLQGTAVRALVSRTIGLRAMLRAKVLLTAVVTAACFVLMAAAPVVDRSTGGLSAGLLAPLVFYYALAGWAELFGVALRAQGRRAEEAGVILALRAGGLLAVVVALRMGAGLTGMAWAHAASTLPATLMAAPLVRRAYHGHDGALPQPPVGPVLRTALPLAVNGGLALLSLRLEQLAVYFVRGAAESGLFGAALKVVESLNGIPGAVAAGAMPSLTREALHALGAVRERVAGMMALLAVPGAVGLLLVAPGVVALLGESYRGAAEPLRVLALALVPLFMNTVLLHALIAAGHARTLPRLTAVRVGLAAVLAVSLIPPFGAMGAAAGFLLSEAMLTVLAARACLAAGFPVPVARPLARAAALAVPMTVVVALAGSSLARGVALGVATYLATLAAIWRAKPELVPLLPRPRAGSLAE
jgi:O-antigen/teichoic acid export membrane protein